MQKWFEENDVKIINCANITKVEEGVVYNHDDAIEADVIVWTAGIQPSKVVREMDVEKDAQGRVVLTPHHNLPGMSMYML